MLEIEAKLRVESLEPIRQTLELLGAAMTGISQQTDHYFNAPDRDFAITDEALRVRYAGDGVQVTYKGPKQPAGGIKAREEINLAVDSGERFEAILLSLGYRKARTVRKLREEWHWRKAHIALDSVEGLGEFVEIELETGAGMERAAERIEAIEKEIGISGPRITISYLELLELRE
jgi:adenylate cyclase class 2